MERFDSMETFDSNFFLKDQTDSVLACVPITWVLWKGFGGKFFPLGYNNGALNLAIHYVGVDFISFKVSKTECEMYKFFLSVHQAGK